MIIYDNLYQSVIIQINNENVKLPDFIIAGVSRSGTTSLYHALMQHPKIFFPSIKESSFFNGPYFKNYNVHESAISTINEYVQLFPGASEETIGEATPAYLYSFETVIPNLKSIYGIKYKDIKIILILRNPAERAFSQYRLFVKYAVESLDFEEAIKTEVMERRRQIRIGYDYVGFGMYYNQVKAFLEHFSNVKVFIYEDFRNNNMKVIKEMFRFLKVDDAFTPKLNLRHNVAGRVKLQWLHDFVFYKKNFIKDFLKPFIPYDLEMKVRQKILEINAQKWEINPYTKKKLISIYKDDIHKLQGLLNRDLSIWFYT
jgi:hypothetical protein